MYEDMGAVAVVVAAAMAVIGVLGLLVWSLVWVYRDAEARGKPGWVVALVVLCLKWPLSLLLWIVFRPERAVSRSRAAG